MVCLTIENIDTLDSIVLRTLLEILSLLANYDIIINRAQTINCSLKANLAITKPKPLKSVQNLGLKLTNQQNGKVSWEVRKTSQFVCFSVVEHLLFVFCNVIWFI